MKAKVLRSSVVFVMAVALVIGFMFHSAMAEMKFGLDDIPEIKNKKPIHVALEAGGGADLIIPYLKKFSDKTGIEVTHESHVFASLYSKEIVELQGQTGAFDLVVTETSWTTEWENYLYPVYELAKKFDPNGVEGLKKDLKGHDPGLLRMCSTAGGTLMGLPYYTYTMMTIYRQDLVDDPTEKANFKKKYGYELAPVTTWEQVRDQAEFFTRKKGESLKGQPLKDDFYGVSLMAGRFPHVQDELGSMLWSKQGRWANPVRDEKGQLKGFKITDKDKQLLTWSFDSYKKLMPFAPPGTENAFWDQATASFATGKTAMIPAMYAALWPWSTTVAKEVPGARAAVTTTPGARPYTGAFHFAPSKDSKNPEAAYWLMRYITCYDAQQQMAETGWASVRRDVLEDPKYKDPVWYEKCGWMPVILKTWTEQFPDVNTYLHFNSAAFGKIYEMMTIIGHENAIGKRTAEESTNEWVKTFTELQNKFGKVPVLN
jgi:multiple sugar transport system substrate-binding protein